MKAYERRQEIIRVLCKRRYETIDNLAFEYGVSRRTIRYDIEELAVSHPIVTVQGNGGGVKVLDDYYLGKECLKPNQQNLLEELLPTLNREQAEIMASILKTFTFPKK